jgi:hypothetical protein
MKAPRAKRAPKITETAEHRTIAAYFRKIGLGAGALAIHIRNERGSAWERMIASQMGILAGIPDWLILHDGDAGFIELKPRGFKDKLLRGVGVTDHILRQIDTHARIRETGCWVEICETLEEMLEALRQHGVPLRTESISTERLRNGFLNAQNEDVE